MCGGGNQLIDPVHVTDVARVLADAIDGPFGSVVEAGCGKAFSVREIAINIASACGGTGLLGFVPPRAGEPVDATVVAARPACENVWPYLVRETADWYREWLS